MNLPKLFNYQDSTIRTFVINNEPWFVNVDVCKVLEIKNPSQAISKLKESQRSLILNEGSANNHEMAIISETGLYKLVLKSRKKEAEAFQDWVCEEVVPSIRKNGSYNVSVLSPEELALQQAQNILNLRKDLNKISDVVNSLVADKNKVLNELNYIETPSVLPLQKTERAKLNQLVRTYSISISQPTQIVWNRLYKEFLYAYRVDVSTCAKNRNISKLDYIESIAKIPDLYALAYKLFIVNELSDIA